MNLLFQNPALLGLLALAGLPALVHLLSRARPPVRRFSNIAFLRRIVRESSRVRRPKDRLLLALRTLAMAALAAAFAAPFLVSKSALSGADRSVVLLIDRSASMAAREGVGTRFDKACAEAAAYLTNASPDFANIVWIDGEPDAAFPEAGPNIAFLRESLERAEPLPEAGALGAAFDLALRQAAAARGHREIIVLSDFQASAWKDFAPDVPENVGLRTFRVATESPSNLTISRLVPQPAEPVVGQELTLLAQVRSFSPEPVRARLTLDAGGAVRSQEIELSPWGTAETAFTLRPAAAGQLPVTASLDADGFPADDSRHVVVAVRDSLRLAVEPSADSPEGRVLAKLASSLDWLRLAETGDGADFRFIADWNGADVETLREAAANGTVMIVRPAAGCPLAALRALLGMPPDPAAGALALDASQAGWQAVPAEEHLANALFSDGDFGNPFTGVFRERLKLPPDLSGASIASYADGVPAMISAAGLPLIVWNLPVDPAKTDWPAQGVFLPAVAEILLHSRPRGAAEPASALPGSFLSWSSPDPAHGSGISLAGRAGEEIPLEAADDGGDPSWRATEPAVPSMFRWRISGQDVAFTAVNFPDSESDLRPLDAAPDFHRAGSEVGSLAREAALAQGIPLWPWLAIAALGFIVLESFVHLRGTPANSPSP